MPNGQDRLPALDALRGIAALGVVLFHYLPYYDKLYGHSFSTPDSANQIVFITEIMTSGTLKQ